MESRSFQDVFKELRMAEKKSQEEIAKDLDISSSLVSKWETNQSTPAPEMLEYIADYFNVSVDYLIGRSKFKRLESKNELDNILFSKAVELDDETKKALIQVMDSTHKEIDKELDK